MMDRDKDVSHQDQFIYDLPTSFSNIKRNNLLELIVKMTIKECWGWAAEVADSEGTIRIGIEYSPNSSALHTCAQQNQAKKRESTINCEVSAKNYQAHKIRTSCEVQVRNSITKPSTFRPATLAAAPTALIHKRERNTLTLNIKNKWTMQIS